MKLTRGDCGGVGSVTTLILFLGEEFYGSYGQTWEADGQTALGPFLEPRAGHMFSA